MYRSFGFIILFITPFISFSQEEKGCGVFTTFSVTYGVTPPETSNNILYCTGTYGVYCTDSVFIDMDMNSEEDVKMHWNFRNETSSGSPFLTPSLVKWYRNDTLMDSNLYVAGDYTGSGACGQQYMAEAKLETRILGAYELRKVFFEAPLAVIVLRKKAAVIEEVEEISFKIYPNPSSDILIIEHGEVNNKEMILMSIDGKIILHPRLENLGSSTEIDISQLPSGSYILTFSSDEHQTVQEKITVI